MNINRILLLMPPVTRPATYAADKMRVSPFFPLGLAYLAAVLRENGYEVKVLDCLLEGVERGAQPYAHVVPEDWAHRSRGSWPDTAIRYGLTDRDILCEILNFAPDVVGVSCLFSAQEWDAVNICRLVKGLDNDAVTVLGGPHAGANAREILDAEPAVDYVVIGEGERALLEIIEHQSMPLPRRIAYSATPIEDLDANPYPAWDLFDMEMYFRLMQPHDRCKQRPWLPVVTSRGCPYRCSFCAIRGHWGMHQRFRSADNVLLEVYQLHERYGVREIHFEDDNLTADKPRALAIFQGLQDMAPGLSWAAPSGLAMRNLDRELLDAMAASGCYSVSLAIESGNQEVLRLMRKPVDLRRVPGLVRGIQSRGMLAKGFFILGYPGETVDTIRQTVEFARSLQLDWSFFFIASPLPHTEMWAQAKAAGMLADGEFNPLTALHEPVLRLPGVDPEWLAETREEATRDICFTNNPNIERNPAQAIADFEHVLGLYPHFDFAREALGRAKANVL